MTSANRHGRVRARAVAGVCLTFLLSDVRTGGCEIHLGRMDFLNVHAPIAKPTAKPSSFADLK